MATKTITSKTSSFYNASILPFDALYGPWDSFEDFVHSVYDEDFDVSRLENWLKAIQPGLTIGIKENGVVVEYWNPEYGKGFVKKNSDISNEIEELEHTVAESLISINERIDGMGQQQLNTSNVIMNGTDTSDTNDFITVTGVTVGGLKPGDKLKNNTTVAQLLRKMLQKEIDVTTQLPSVKLVGYPSDVYYEIGGQVFGTLSYTFTDGRFKGAETGYNYNIAAGCSVVSSSFTPREAYTGTIITEGNNTFGVEVEYSASSVTPKTNVGNDSNVKINQGTATDTKTVKGAYKVWYGNVAFSNRDKMLGVLDASAINTLKSLTLGWVNNTTNLNIGSVSTGAEEIFCVLCPDTFELLGKQMGLDSEPVVNQNIYVYTLPNGVNVNYRLYMYGSVDQNYTDVKVNKK